MTDIRELLGKTITKVTIVKGHIVLQDQNGSSFFMSEIANSFDREGNFFEGTEEPDFKYWLNNTSIECLKKAEDDYSANYYDLFSKAIYDRWKVEITSRFLATNNMYQIELALQKAYNVKFR